MFLFLNKIPQYKTMLIDKLLLINRYFLLRKNWSIFQQKKNNANKKIFYDINVNFAFQTRKYKVRKMFSVRL